MSIYIQLFHGHHTADEELEDWGFDGPILGPFPWFHITYGDDIKLGDDPIIVAREEITFPTHDDNGFIPFLGAFYGDMSITDGDTILNNPNSLIRVKDTRAAFKITGNDFAKHINDPVEWIKHYAICKLKELI
jgi:hypothetical protein